MSNPENLLARYRSYAYHHILIACDSTETAEFISNETDVTSFQRFGEQGRYDAVSLKAGGYVVLIDGLTDSEFSVLSATWNTVITPNEYDQTAMMQLDGELQILEPFGARFMNVITNVCDQLETDPTGLVFVLKTIFVGYNDDHHDFNVEMHSNFRPLLFTLVNITANFDETGAIYNVALVGAANGYGKLPHVSKVTRGLSLNIDTTETLAQTLKKLEDTINTNYEASAARLGIDFGTSTELGDYRRVRYEIKAPQYDDEKYTAGTNENERLADKTNTITIQPGADMPIENIIEQIMRSSKGVTDDAVGEEKFLFKINSFLRSTPTTVIVEYQVNRYQLGTQSFEQAAQNRVGTNTQDLPVLEFDYIFTGVNTDIINFDMKMEMGLAFFHTATTSNNVPTQREAASMPQELQTPGGSGGMAKASGTFKHRKKTPLFLGDQISDPKVRNSKNPVSSATFQAMLSRHAALENLGVVLKIHGNPNLMAEMLKFRVDESELDTDVSHLSAPSLVKINIRMPSSSRDLTGTFASEPFWYEGLFMLHSVKTMFEGGEFTQELTMFSLMIDDPTTDKTDEQPTDELRGTQEPGNTTVVEDVDKGTAADKIKAINDGGSN